MSFDSSFDDKERIRQALSIEEVVGNYLELRRQGSAFSAVCPWHDDHRPSLQINPARQSWKCWVCDIGGDIFSFVMRRENVEFGEAMQILARMAGIELTRRTAKTHAGDPNDKPTLYKAMAWVEQQFHQNLLHSPEAEAARNYLTDRNVLQSAIESFHIGYAPDQFQWLIEKARSTEFSELVLKAIGVAKDAEQSNRCYDRFRGRVIFPIRDSSNRPVALGGRVIPELSKKHEEKYGDPPAKYINSPETRLFAKSEQLYGLNLMRDAISKARHMVVVEGYTDVIAAWQAGLDNVVAVLGTALAQRHLRLIRRFADKVTLVLDGDEAGQRRTNEILELFVTADIDLRIMTLPEQLDPCDFLEQNGAAEFRNRVEQSVDAFDHKIKIETENIDLMRDTHRSNQALERILTTIARSPRQMASKSQTGLREQQLLSRLSRRFQVEVEQLRQRLIDLRGRMRKQNSAGKKSPQLKLTSPECELIQIILEGPEIFPKVFENLTQSQIDHEVIAKLFDAMCQCHHAGTVPGFDEVMLRLEDEELKNALICLDEAANDKAQSTTANVESRLDQLIEAFKLQRQRHVEKHAISKLQQDADDAEEEEIMKQLMEQALHRQGISAPTEG